MKFKPFILPALFVACHTFSTARIDTITCISGKWFPSVDSSDLCLKIRGVYIDDGLDLDYVVRANGKEYSLMKFYRPRIDSDQFWKSEVKDCPNDMNCRWKFFTQDWKDLSGRKDMISPDYISKLAKDLYYPDSSPQCSKNCEWRLKKEAVQIMLQNKSRYIVVFTYPEEPKGPIVYFPSENKFIRFSLDW